MFEHVYHLHQLPIGDFGRVDQPHGRRLEAEPDSTDVYVSSQRALAPALRKPRRDVTTSLTEFDGEDRLITIKSTTLLCTAARWGQRQRARTPWRCHLSLQALLHRHCRRYFAVTVMSTDLVMILQRSQCGSLCRKITLTQTSTVQHAVPTVIGHQARCKLRCSCRHARQLLAFVHTRSRVCA